MSIVEALILGIVQGLTEFLPVSSSGHLVIFHHLFGSNSSGLAFDVALHGGTLTALLIYFRNDVLELAKSLIQKSEKTRLAWLLILATMPAAIFGYILKESAESSFRSVKLVAITMLGFGLIMLVAEKYYARRKTHDSLDKLSAKKALGLGIAQALALVPGISRSGSTITTGLLIGLDRVSATRFSFLLGIPITLGAIVKVFTEEGVLIQVQSDKTIFLIGIVSALLSGLFAIRFMIRYLSKHGLQIFAYYRIALGLLILISLSIR